MRTIAIVGLLGLLIATAGYADVTFKVKDYLHHEWHNEFVSYLVDPGQVPDPAMLAGPGGEETAVQITPRGNKTEVAFIVDYLAADDTARYVLSKGAEQGQIGPNRHAPGPGADSPQQRNDQRPGAEPGQADGNEGGDPRGRGPTAGRLLRGGRQVDRQGADGRRLAAAGLERLSPDHRFGLR